MMPYPDTPCMPYLPIYIGLIWGVNVGKHSIHGMLEVGSGFQLFQLGKLEGAQHPATLSWMKMTP